MTDLQRLYGLVVASEFPLHQERPVPPGTPADVRLRWGEPRTAEVQARPVAGDVLLEVSWEDGPGYAFVERPDGTCLLRFTGTCDMEVSADLADVAVHPVQGADPGVAVVLATGAVLAFQLYRRGHAVLHASAVAIDGAALAFVGPSGSGKSTMATLMCADGAELITDDVLRLDADTDTGTDGGAGTEPLRVHLGATGLRLRKGADTLVSRFGGDGPGQRLSADLRQVLSPRSAGADRLPLAAIVVPFPNRELDRVSVVRREPKDALFDLLRYPRLLGWRDAAVLRQQLAHLATIVGRVPVYEAYVPWGPPFPETVAADLRAAIPELPQLPQPPQPPQAPQPPQVAASSSSGR